jgi:hypothetical protein
MDSFKDHLLEWGFFKKKEAPKPAPAPVAATAPAPRTGFMSRNKNDPAHTLHRDLLQSEYRKHNDTPEVNHTAATRKRRDELEKEVVRRGGKARERPEWHDAYLNRQKPEGRIHWKDENGKQHRGY